MLNLIQHPVGAGLAPARATVKVAPTGNLDSRLHQNDNALIAPQIKQVISGSCRISSIKSWILTFVRMTEIDALQQ
jgi:hypothetical protein